MKTFIRFFVALAIVLVCGVSFVMIQNDETEVSANEEALGFLQPCRISDDYRTCDEEQEGVMCFCELDYSR
ncbi:MAG: hypothetical protein MJZ73_11630 [Bacteroidaceae bacterium]|nr:hypothetical protein [Bacteroidaceae bacterium]